MEYFFEHPYFKIYEVILMAIEFIHWECSLAKSTKLFILCSRSSSKHLGINQYLVKCKNLNYENFIAYINDLVK